MKNIGTNIKNNIKNNDGLAQKINKIVCVTK